MKPKHPQTEPEEPDSPKVLSASSPIQLGLVITVVGLLIGCVGGFGYWNWWASAISTKLDIVIQNQKDLGTLNAKLVADIVELQGWRKTVDASGTPAMKTRVDSLESTMIQLKRDFDIHMATSKP